MRCMYFLLRGLHFPVCFLALLLGMLSAWLTMWWDYGITLFRRDLNYLWDTITILNSWWDLNSRHEPRSPAQASMVPTTPVCQCLSGILVDSVYNHLSFLFCDFNKSGTGKTQSSSYWHYTVWRISHPDWLISSQHLVMFESLTLQDQSGIFLKLYNSTARKCRQKQWTCYKHFFCFKHKHNV